MLFITNLGPKKYWVQKTLGENNWVTKTYGCKQILGRSTILVKKNLVFKRFCVQKMLGP